MGERVHGGGRGRIERGIRDRENYKYQEREGARLIEGQQKEEEGRKGSEERKEEER